MQVLYCHLSSGCTDGFLRASTRLQQLTHETWTINWQKLQLECAHGVSIPISQAEAGQADTLGSVLMKRHSQMVSAAPETHRQRRQGIWKKLARLGKPMA